MSSTEFSFSSVTAAPVILFILVLIALKWLITAIVQKRMREGGGNNDDVTGQADAFAVDLDEGATSVGDESMMMFDSPDDQHRRLVIRAVIGGALALALACTYWFYYDAIGRRWRGLDEFVLDPQSGSKKVRHPDDGEAKHAYMFCYSLGVLPIVLYVCFAILWRYGSRSGQIAAAAVDHQALLHRRRSARSFEARLCRWRITFFILGLFLSIVVGLGCCVASLSHYMLYCNYKPKQFEQLCDFAYDLTQEIEAVTGRRTIWLHNGALLAAWRPFNRVNNGFIPNDHDFDMCMERNDFNKMHEYLKNSTKHYWYHTLVGSHPQKVRIYPAWSKVYEGHSGMWCVDIDECDYKHDNLVTLDACNGHFWSVTSKRDSIAYFKTEYPQGPWNVSNAFNHYGLCSILPGW